MSVSRSVGLSVGRSVGRSVCLSVCLTATSFIDELCCRNCIYAVGNGVFILLEYSVVTFGLFSGDSSSTSHIVSR